MTENRMQKIASAVLEQLREKDVETLEEAHATYVVVLNPLDHSFMREMCWQLSKERTRKDQNKRLWIHGFECWRSPAIPLGNPRLLSREDAAGVLGEFAERVARST